MTLEIHVFDMVTVKDIVNKIEELFQKFINFVVPLKIEIIKQEVNKSDSNKSPPDLGIFVSDSVRTVEKLGPSY